MDILAELTTEQQELADALNMRELAFANLWLTTDQHGMSRTDCYKMAGYAAKNDNVAAVESGRYLKKPKIWKYTRAMRNKAIEETGLTLQYLDQQLKDIIDGSAIEVMPVVAVEGKCPLTGELETHYIPRLVCTSDDLPPEVQSAIQSIKVGQNGPEVKMYSRVDALKLAYQRQGALKEGRELTGPGGSALSAPMFAYQIVGGPGQEPPVEEPTE